MLVEHLRIANEQFLPGHLIFGPKHIVLGVNNFCNLRCVMCDVGTKNQETNFGANLVGAKTRSMPWELFRHIADDIAASFPNTHLAFAYTEPLAWGPLGEALAYARSLGLFTSVTSNGLLLPRRAMELAGGACSALSISLDGPPAVHDAIRRRKGSYARAVEGIEAISVMPGAPDASVCHTITEWNVGYIREFLAGLRKYKLKRVCLLHNNFITQSQALSHNLLYAGMLGATPSNVFEADPTNIDIETLSFELTEVVRTEYPFAVDIQPRLTTHQDLQTYYRDPERFVGRRCNDAFRMLMIDSDGQAIPVHGRCFRFPIANVRDTTMKDIWNHAHLATLRRALKKAGGLLPACSRCCGGFG